MAAANEGLKNQNPDAAEKALNAAIASLDQAENLYKESMLNSILANVNGAFNNQQILLRDRKNAEELKKILAPKKKKKFKKFYIDFSEFLSNGHFTGWIDLTKGSISTDKLVSAFLKAKEFLTGKVEDKDEIIFEKAKEFHANRLEEERKAYNEEQKKNIEERKQKMLKEQQQGKEIKVESDEKYIPLKVNFGKERD